MPAAPPPPPAQAAIIITAQALAEAKADRVYDIERIDRRRIEISPTHALDPFLKDVPACNCSAARFPKRPSEDCGRADVAMPA